MFGRDPFHLSTVCGLAVPRIAHNHPVFIQAVHVACSAASCSSRSHARLPNDIAVQQPARAGAKRPTRRSDCNGGLDAHRCRRPSPRVELGERLVEVFVASRVGERSLRRVTKVARLPASTTETAESAREALLRQSLWRRVPQIAVAVASAVDVLRHSSVRLTILAFSGGRTRERSDRGARPTATAC